MEHRIKYNYNTGDSFNQYPDQTGYLDETWQVLEVATENMKRMEEHYRAYKLLNGYSNYGKGSWDDYKNERWYVTDNPQYNICLLLDDKKPYNTTTYDWCGYFEHLNFIEIEVSNLKIII